MGRYLLRRILQMIPVVLGTTLLVYAWCSRCRATRLRRCFGDKRSMRPSPRRFVPNTIWINRSSCSICCS